MIILRNDNTVPSTRGPFDPFPESFFDDVIKWKGQFDKIEIKLEYSDQYSDDMKVLGSVDKAIVRQYKKDLAAGYIVTNRLPKDNTHYLKKYSKPSKYLRFSKDLTSTMDRFDYIIYKPILDKVNRTLIIKITVQSLLDHKIPGQGTYSDTTE